MGTTRRDRRLTWAAALALTAAVGAGAVLAAPADLDSGFGRDGRATIGSGPGISDFGYALAVQPDGRIVAAGVASSGGSDAAAYRLTPTGRPDPSFDADGASTIGAPSSREEAYAVALQPDGKIVAAGFTSVGDNGAVWRFTPSGGFDPSFDGDGAAGIDSGGIESASAVAVQPDGRIVVAGSTSLSSQAAVWRLTATGQPDPTFDDDGARGIDLGRTEIGAALALQPDGRIVIVGLSGANNVTNAFAVRLTAAGQPDPTFGGGDGIAEIDTGFDDVASAVALQPDGRIVLAGDTDRNEDMTVYRLTAAGALDPTFGRDGVVTLDRGGDEEGTAVAIQADGRIVVGGETSAGNDGIIYRLRADGSRDPEFGDNGERVVGGGLERIEALAIQADGRILVAGDDSALSPDVLVYRLQGDGTPAPGEPAPGPTGRPPGSPGGAVLRCQGVRATIVGTARADRIRGTRGRDVVVALGGDDTIRGLGGNDLVCAGAGDDRLVGGPGRDVLHGGPGRDQLNGGPGRDRLVGGPGRDTVIGRQRLDIVVG